MKLSKPDISFEFFPPKSEKALKALSAEAKILSRLSPKFMTVTYGAGGSTREGTLGSVRAVRKETGVDTAMHLTYINTPIKDMKAFTNEIWEEGIRHIVALRGDLPGDLSWPLDEDKDYFQYSSDFVEALKKWHDFEISVGAYPEKHPDSPNVEADVFALKKKYEAGADRAITQFFFDNDVYFRFVERCHKAGVDMPVVPGLLPVANYEKMLGFAERCQASVPTWLREKFESVSDPKARYEMGVEILAHQIEDLVKGGVPHIHFYTLNKADMCADAIKRSGLANDAGAAGGGIMKARLK